MASTSPPPPARRHPRRTHSPKARKFYQMEEQPEDAPRGHHGTCDGERLAAHIRSDMIGSDAVFSGPYGDRPVVYCDYVASGRSLASVEDFIATEVLPLYSNTHTTTTATSMQTTMFRHEARDAVRNAVNASEHDAVIFAGSGCTGAVHKLIQAVEVDEGVAVVVSGMEHHSNLLPWRDLGAEVFMTEEDDLGRVDLVKLDQLLRRLKGRRIIGCFCAASNITGALNDDVAITALLHAHGALSFWDYATAAPYVNIDMNPRLEAGGAINSKSAEKDALFFSVHKFVGGVQSPGVLVAKKCLFRPDAAPNGGGGGSVFFVGRDDHRYLQDAELREEGGTPAIVEGIRAGMAMQLKAAVDVGYVMRREEELMERVRKRLVGRCDNFVVLGSPDVARLPVVSFLAHHPETGAYLHHNFLCAVLNDVFGVQARGGCACAGPYAQSLLGIDARMADDYEHVLMEDDRLDRTHLRRGQAEYSSFEVLRPGFARLNLAWFSSDAEVDYILEAVAMTCERAWTLLPQYRFNNETGEWKHFDDLDYKERKWLGSISYASGAFEFRGKRQQRKTNAGEEPDYKALLEAAESVFAGAKRQASKRHVPDQRVLFTANTETERLRWFLLPFEAKQILTAGDSFSVKPPFRVRSWASTEKSNTDPCSVGSYGGTGYTTDSEVAELLQGNASNQHIDWHKTASKSRHKVNGKTEPAEESPEKNVSCDDGLCVLKGDRGPAPVVKPVKSGWRSPPKEIFRPFLEAMEEFKMVGPGDRVLVCLSGGKDSLSLLHALRQYQHYVKKSGNGGGFTFDLGAVTVDPKSSAYDPRPLVPYLASLGVPYFYEEQAIMEQALAADASSICSFCSRLKRGRIYAAARREGYNVLAMGQHLDDLAESFMMSVFHNGRLRTMKANYAVKEGDLRVVRPFVYVREKQLREFAEKQGLPIIPENCPACFESPKERHRTKQLLAQQELLFPRLYWSLRSAMMPVMSINRTGIESRVFGNKARGDNDGDDDDEECEL